MLHSSPPTCGPRWEERLARFWFNLHAAFGLRIHNAIAKIGSIADVQVEGEKCEAFVSRLEPASTRHKLSGLHRHRKNLEPIDIRLETITSFRLFFLPGFEWAESSVTHWNRNEIRGRLRCQHPQLLAAADSATELIRDAPANRAGHHNCVKWSRIAI